MLPVILRLFRWTPLFQLLLSGAAFFALMVLITIRLLYSYGLTASLSSSAPHLTAEFIQGESEDETQLATLQQAFEGAEAISVYSLFLKGTRTLKIEPPAYMTGQYKFEAPVEIIGIDIKDIASTYISRPNLLTEFSHSDKSFCTIRRPKKISPLTRYR